MNKHRSLNASLRQCFVKLCQEKLLRTVQMVYLTFKEEDFVLRSGLYLQESFLLAISILSAFVEKHHCHGTALFMVRLLPTTTTTTTTRLRKQRIKALQF